MKNSIRKTLLGMIDDKSLSEKDVKRYLLKNTIEYYQENPERICVCSTERTCYYSPKSAGKEGISDGCAIGRLLKISERGYFDEKNVGTIDTYFNSYQEDENITKRTHKMLQYFGESFLTSLQELHDSGNLKDITFKEALKQFGL